MKVFTDSDRMMIIVDKGEKLVETIAREVGLAKLRGGMITGLGALTDVELGFYQRRRHDRGFDRSVWVPTDARDESRDRPRPYQLPGTLTPT